MSGAGWDLAQDNFMAHCGAEKGLATASLEAIRFDLARLRRWSETEGITAPTSIRDHHLRSFLMESAGELGPSSRARLLSTLRSFFRFLVAEDLTTVDPTTTLIAPRRGRKLPAVLTLNQVERLLETVDGARPVRMQGQRTLRTGRDRPGSIRSHTSAARQGAETTTCTRGGTSPRCGWSVSEGGPSGSPRQGS